MTTRRVEKISNAAHWKDRAAGWAKWRVHIPVCRGCGKHPASYTLSGTATQVHRMAQDPNFDYCDRCS